MSSASLSVSSRSVSSSSKEPRASSSRHSTSSHSKSRSHDKDRRKKAVRSTFRDGELKSLFKKYDLDNSGDIEVKELRPLLQSKDFFFSTDNLKILIAKFDPDEKGTLTYPQFKNFIYFINEMFVAFRNVDANGSGFINNAELRTAFSTMGFSFSRKIVDWIVDCFDEDGNGRLDLQEFINLTCFLNQLREEFNERDTDGSGTLDYQELRPIIKKLGVKKECAEVLRRYDQDGSGELGFEEFVALLFDLRFKKGKDVEYGGGKHIQLGI